VDELSGSLAFVTHCCGLRCPDDFTGEWVALAQARHVVASQNATDRSRRETELGAEPVLTPAVLATGIQHLLLDCWTGACRRRVRARAAVVEPNVAFSCESCDPSMSALTGDAHCLRDVRDRHPGLDTLDEQPTAMNG
jgi:hypothetical protein